MYALRVGDGDFFPFDRFPGSREQGQLELRALADLRLRQRGQLSENGKPDVLHDEEFSLLVSTSLNRSLAVHIIPVVQELTLLHRERAQDKVRRHAGQGDKEKLE